jgi:hypothetical protein
MCGYAMQRVNNAPCIAKMALKFGHRDCLEGYDFLMVKEYIYSKVENLEQTIAKVQKVELTTEDKDMNERKNEKLESSADEKEWISDEDAFIEQYF